MTAHVRIVHHKVGEETGLLLKAAGCTCGWHAGIWYSSTGYVTESFKRHARAVAEGSTVPWMVGPGGGAA